MPLSLRTGSASDLAWINQRYDEIGFLRSTPADYLVVAEMDHVPAGIGRLVTIDESSGELGGIYVFPEFRRQGVAEKIVGHLVSADRHRRLFCLPFSKLKDFYCRFGFREVRDSEGVPKKIRDKLNWCNDNPDYEDSTILLIK